MNCGDIDILCKALAPLTGKLSQALVYERASWMSTGPDDPEAVDIHLLLVLLSGKEVPLVLIQELLFPAEEAMKRRIMLTALDEEEWLQAPRWLQSIKAQPSVDLLSVLQVAPGQEDEVRIVLAKVEALVPEFNMVDLLDEADCCLAVTRRTRGIDWTTLEVGQVLRCTVKGRFAPRVLSAELVDPALYTPPESA